MRTPLLRITAILVLALAAGGCVSEQYAQFNGTVDRGTPLTARKIKYDIGAQWGDRPDDATEGLWGFDVAEVGGIVLVFDKATVVADDYRLSDRAIKAWYVSPENWEAVDWPRFAKSSDADRVGTNYVSPLVGRVNVERWKNNVDLRVRLAVQSAGPEAVRLDGTLDYYRQWEWQPHQAIAVIASSMGIGSP